MELNINERIALLLALQNRRSHLIKTVRNKIDYLKSLEVDITENRDISYFVNEVNLCTRLMRKIWNY